MPAQEERQPTEKILIDLPLIPHPGSIQLVSEHCEGTTPPHHLLQSWEKGNVGVVDAVRISRAPFCQQTGEKSFLRKRKKENVTRLPNVISLLTCEWRALQQLACLISHLSRLHDTLKPFQR